jgi:hypothetical protein
MQTPEKTDPDEPTAKVPAFRPDEGEALGASPDAPTLVDLGVRRVGDPADTADADGDAADADAHADDGAP